MYGLYPRLCQKVLVLKSYEEKNTLFDNIDYFTTPKIMANLMKYLSSGLEKDLDKLGPTPPFIDLGNGLPIVAEESKIFQTKIAYGNLGQQFDL